MVQIGPLDWKARTSFSDRVVRFSAPSEFGVFDHAVYQAGDEPIVMPMRVVPNGEGGDPMFVFYRRPGVSDEQFASSVEWVTNDFLTLQALLEA